MDTLSNSAESNYCKNILFSPILQLSTFSDMSSTFNDCFDIQSIKDNYLYYKSVFFSCVIDMLDEFYTDDHNWMKYITNNISTDIQFNNKEELIHALKIESTKDNASLRFINLGFRSIYALLDKNFNTITPEYLLEINKKLSPFFFAFKDKDLLLTGYGIEKDE